jgi:hypothetical protein
MAVAEEIPTGQTVGEETMIDNVTHRARYSAQRIADTDMRYD